jgi:hypothetical protein
MIIDSHNTFTEGINEIVNYTKDKKLKKIIVDTIEKYSEFDSKFNLQTANEVFESLKWIAEERKDSNALRNAIECFLMKNVMETVSKYHGDVSNEVLNNIILRIEKHLDKNIVQKYVNWINNGHILKLLNFADELNGGNLKIKKDIFSIIDIIENGLEKFDYYADKISNKKLFLEKKLELFSILRDIINKNKDYYAEILVNKGIKELSRCVENDLNKIKFLDNPSSLKCAIKFTEDMKKDKNLEFLFNKHKEFGNIRKWLSTDSVTKKIIKKMEESGFDSNLYIASGKIITQTRTEGNFSENWSDVLKTIVIKIVGSKRNKTLPKISIPNAVPGAIFKKIKNYYFDVLNQDKNAAKKLLKELKEIILKSYSEKKMPKSVNEILRDIECLEKVIDYGGVATYRGAKMTAKVWKRRVPEDFYDSERLRCCIYLPNGEKKTEVPLFMMDPQTTLVQFYIQGINEPVAAATFYTGISEGKSVLLMDTWDAGGLAYAALPDSKMQNFALKTMIKFGREVGAKKLLIFTGAVYGRPEEFCGYLRDRGFKTEEVYFQAIDPEDSILKTFSVGEKHHYTDVFNTSPLEGKIKAFIFDL